MPRPKTNKPRKVQDTKKAKLESNRNATIEESFIIFLVLSNNIGLNLRRKTKNDSDEEKVENITIEKILDDELENKVKRIFSQWRSEQTLENICDKPHKLYQRDTDRTLLNIYFNVLLEELIKIHGDNNVKIKTARKALKTISRKRLEKWFDMSKDDMKYIGEQTNKWLKQFLQIPDDTTKMESIKQVHFDNMPLELKEFVVSTIPMISVEGSDNVYEHYQDTMGDYFQSTGFLNIDQI